MADFEVSSNEKMRAALEKIAKWYGEFPPTGRFYETADGTQKESSYGSCYGSNGERDYMRQVARDALK